MQSTVACDWVHKSLRLVDQLVKICLQLIQTTSFAIHPRLVNYNIVALVWIYCSFLLVALESCTCWFLARRQKAIVSIYLNDIVFLSQSSNTIDWFYCSSLLIVMTSITGGSGDAVRTTEITQADVDAANRQILERMMRKDRERERERRIHYIRGRFTAFAQIWKDAKFVLTLCDLPLGGAGVTAYELAEIQKEILLPLKKLMTVEIEDYK
ncbi:hypothetical protein F511_18889 [Dorcoceras hygrometricum]|uniref:Uncharacterized protein n=1 Tax=Dorcoceras hygrometricum TaxID=472368 RepID=A0A2Z7AHR7_9LAMI|nr:hypothetical protein F511_18889 [Dorcoceras hygrometricum]